MAKTFKVGVEKRGDFLLWFAKINGERYVRETRSACLPGLSTSTKKRIAAIQDGDSILTSFNMGWAFTFTR